MPSLRMDPITGRWVILATERAKRPVDLQTHFDRPNGTFCPFCLGNEESTPPAIETFEGSETWEVRVIPNKYPALRVEGDLGRRDIGVYTEMNGVGAHEVIIETPEHLIDFADLGHSQMTRVFAAWRARIRDLKHDRRLKCAMVFKNHGAQAGASMEHAHSQLVALPFIHGVLREELDGSKRYFEEHGENVFTAIVKQELESGDRVVYENDKIVAVCPYASRLPFELCFMPKKARPRFEAPLDDGTMSALADAVLEVSARLNAALDYPPYNMMLHSAPYGDEEYSHFSWHLELVPTLTRMAGFERGTGSFINPTPPELAASHLRDVTVP